MGLFDKLLNQGTKALGNMVSDALMNDTGEVGKTLRNVKSAINSLGELADTAKTTGTVTKQEVPACDTEDSRSFDEKLKVILDNAGAYDVRRDISPDELEQEAGSQIYTRHGGWSKPNVITYGIYKEGQRVLFINLWTEYKYYAHKANRQVREYCDTHGIKVLDFFDYMPNEFAYMEERVRGQLV